MDGILDILKKLRTRYPSFSKRVQEVEAMGRWETAVGPGIARHTRAIRVENAVLWVEVDHPVWKTELHYRKHQILGILNQNATARTLEDILFLEPLGRGR